MVDELLAARKVVVEENCIQGERQFALVARATRSECCHKLFVDFGTKSKRVGQLQKLALQLRRSFEQLSARVHGSPQSRSPTRSVQEIPLRVLDVETHLNGA